MSEIRAIAKSALLHAIEGHLAQGGKIKPGLRLKLTQGWDAAAQEKTKIDGELKDCFPPNVYRYKEDPDDVVVEPQFEWVLVVDASELLGVDLLFRQPSARVSSIKP